jgi:hypothetical protein
MESDSLSGYMTLSSFSSLPLIGRWLLFKFRCLSDYSKAWLETGISAEQSLGLPQEEKFHFKE